MGRIAAGRMAAEPTSPSQKVRQRRILRVARELATDRGVEAVQMQDVARGAEVAMGTLYRYFPSKVHLFTAVTADQVDRLSTTFGAVESTGHPEQDVFRMLASASRELLRRPSLAAGLLQSTNSAHATQVPDAGRIDDAFRELLLRKLCPGAPSDGDRTAVWLIMQCWYGLLTSCLNGRTTPAALAGDLEVACRLLLSPAARASIPSDGPTRTNPVNEQQVS